MAAMWRRDGHRATSAEGVFSYVQVHKQRMGAAHIFTC